MAAMRRGYAVTRMGQIHYAVAGTGPPLVLLPQGGRSCRMFDSLAAALAEDFHSIAVDFPGSGGSDPLPDGATFEDIAAAVVDLMDALALPSAFVYGVHTGNKIAAALAAGWPERVRKVVLAGQSHSIVPDNQRRSQTVGKTRRKFLEAGDPREAALVRWADVFSVVSGLWWREPLMRDIANPTLRAQAALQARDEIETSDSMPGLYRANFAFDLHGAYARIAVPALVLEIATPSEDRLIGRQGPAVLWSSAAPGSRRSRRRTTTASRSSIGRRMSHGSCAGSSPTRRLDLREETAEHRAPRRRGWRPAVPAGARMPNCRRPRGDSMNAAVRRHFLGIAAMRLLALAPGGASAQAADEVVFAGFGGTLESLFRDKIAPALLKATGIKLNYVVGTALGNYGKLVATRAKPDVDVYWSNELTHAAGKQQGLYAKLDPAIVTNLKDVLAIARDPDDIGVASYLIATVIQYNTQAYAEAGIPPPTSWEDLWDPRLKGKVALLTFNVAASQDFLVLMTKASGGTEADIRPGIRKIKALRDMGNLTSFAATPAELDNMLIQKQAWVTVASSPRPLILKQKGAPIDAAFPKEGAGFFTNYFDVVKGAPHARNAQILVNFLISPEIQRLIAEEAVATPIHKSVPTPKALEGRMPAGEQGMGMLVRIDRVTMNRDLDAWSELWNREIEAKK